VRAELLVQIEGTYSEANTMRAPFFLLLRHTIFDPVPVLVVGWALVFGLECLAQQPVPRWTEPRLAVLVRGALSETWDVDDEGRSVRQTMSDELNSTPVAEDQDADFIIGEGWITSPGGAYRAAVSVGGKATFAVVSRKTSGTSTPIRNTQFDFQLAGLTFHSDSHEWIETSGARVQLMGTGTINEDGKYVFLLIAIDGHKQGGGGGGDDKLRVKIWDEATGELVYDNETGADDLAEPTTPLSGGSIVFHNVRLLRIGTP
jgi:hypothetical protein